MYTLFDLETMHRATVIIITMLALSPLSGCVTSSTTGHPSDQQPGANQDNPGAIGEVLASRGYVTVPLERMTTSHLVVMVRINHSNPMRFVLDTGAGVNVVFPTLIEQLGLTPTDTGDTAGGVGGSGFAMQSVGISSLTLGEHEFQDKSIMVMDFSHLNDQFSAVGEDPVHGIIGSPWLIEHKGVIDVEGLHLHAMQ